MKISLHQVYEDIANFFRHGHPFLKMFLVLFPILLGYVLYTFIALIPFATATSIQSGLTLIAELLGVILGTILVIVVLLIDQLRQAESVLAMAYPKYLDFAKTNRQSIASGGHQFQKLVRNSKLTLSERIAEESSKSAKETIAFFASLSCAVNAEENEEIEKQLGSIGYSEDEIIDIVWVKGSTSILSPYDFLNLLQEALDPLVVFPWCTGKIFEVTDEVFQGFYSEGITNAIDRHKTSRDFLRSRTLALAIGITTLTLFLAVFTIFGVTETTYNSLKVLVPIYVSLIGFLISVFLSSLSLRKMFSAGIS